MKKNWLGIIKSAVLLGLIAICMMVSAKDVKAANVLRGPWDWGNPEAGSTPTSAVKATLYDDGTLVIEGSGNMKGVGDGRYTPWGNENYRESIKKVIIKEGVTNTGAYSFSGCTNLESVEIANSVTTISCFSFNKCYSLKSLIIPNSVTSIIDDAFYECTGLTSVTIPESVTTIGKGAFYKCSSLESIAIPNGVTTIKQSTFHNCSNLTSITIPAGVTSIGEKSFANCSNLTTITFEGNPTTINSDAFDNCTPTTVRFTDNACSDASKVNTILKNLPSSITEIVVPDEKIDVVKSAIKSDESRTPDDITRLCSELKKQTSYDAEHKPAPKTEENVEVKEEQKTASEGTPTGPSKSVYEEKMDSLIKDINALMSDIASTSADTKSADGNKSTNSKKTLYLKDVTSLSLSAMKALKSNPNVNLDMTYTYKGIAFHVVIPAGTAVFDESIPWYGPLWLYAHFGQGSLTDVSNSNANVYVVQSSDTLRKIAAKYGLTLEELVKKNPQIKNVDRISIGDKIFY